jgi:hypothetical protein
VSTDTSFTNFTALLLLDFRFLLDAAMSASIGPEDNDDSERTTP